MTWLRRGELEADGSHEIVGQRLDEIRPLAPAAISHSASPSAGSVFRNPPGDSAGRDHRPGLGMKGLRIGGATVQREHADFIVNDQNGTASDVQTPSASSCASARAPSETGLEARLRDRVCG